ncbi:hypothetical protein rosag_06960 [Roseisolibacter agri]|uniref:Uncharacterized protein n=1 Tax=Roseisolibacter agri TaxID=2014610 RepID=A0AA37QCH3_9BACT|nr:hypothetical protein rosag_06960 [Roseisolibacter agri]
MGGRQRTRAAQPLHQAALGARGGDGDDGGTHGASLRQRGGETRTALPWGSAVARRRRDGASRPLRQKMKTGVPTGTFW